MSRVAKKPIALPKGVDLTVQPTNVSVKGPKGTLSIDKPEGIEVRIEDGTALLSANDDALIPLTGTLRAIMFSTTMDLPLLGLPARSTRDGCSRFSGSSLAAVFSCSSLSGFCSGTISQPSAMIIVCL